MPAAAQQLDAHFSCGQQREQDGLSTEYADSGAIKVDGTKIVEFYWESSIFRSTHGLECSIDQGDGLQAEVTGDASWRFSLQDAKARARQARLRLQPRLQLHDTGGTRGRQRAYQPKLPGPMRIAPEFYGIVVRFEERRLPLRRLRFTETRILCNGKSLSALKHIAV